MALDGLNGGNFLIASALARLQGGGLDLPGQGGWMYVPKGTPRQTHINKLPVSRERHTWATAASHKDLKRCKTFLDLCDNV